MNEFLNKKIFITGAGSIGTEILRQILEYDPHSVRIFDNNEYNLHKIKQLFKNVPKVKILFGDIRDNKRLEIAMNNVDIVFHTAALKHVSFCEENPLDATKTNIIGTQNVINNAIDGIVSKFVYISTDKAVDPINVMGATKLLAERLVISADNYKERQDIVFCSVRFGNVINSSGSVTEIFKNQMKENKALTITNPDMTRFIMTIENAVKLIFKATQLCKGREIFILKMPSVKIVDIAESISSQPFEIIGSDRTEKIHEVLITNQEIPNSFEDKDIIAIVPKSLEQHYKSLGFTKSKKGYSSCDYLNLSKEELKRMIYNEDIGDTPNQ